jgi:cytidylate kinase
MIITIDGPAGSGKSTAARKLAARLEVPYLDTGAMYRAVALKALRENVDLRDADALLATARAADIRLDCGPTHTRVILDGHDVSEAVRSMEVSDVTGFVAKNQAIRTILIEKQREIGRQLGSLVTEGRDQGSVVFPDADVKFVLDAAVEKRAQRRYMEMAADGEDVVFEEVQSNLTERDNNDASQWAPLLESGRAVCVDTTDMTLAEVVDRLYAEVQRRGKESAGSP